MKIVDYDYEFSFKQNEMQELETEKFEGELKALIISTTKPCNLEISFAEIDITIFKDVDFKSESYVPLKVTTIDMNNEKFNFAPDSYFLNNKLKIKIYGVMDSSTMITLRVLED